MTACSLNWDTYNTFRGLADLGDFRHFVYLGIAVHKQYSLLDTPFNYIFHFGPPEKYL